MTHGGEWISPLPANFYFFQIVTLTTVAGGVTTTYTYTYDDNGNILSISDGTSTTSYVYDSANQLTRENNQAGDYTHTWTYDNAGNILSRSEYGDKRTVPLSLREPSSCPSIGTKFPGNNVEVMFCGNEMTPEMLGNFAYGYLGREYGIPLPLLIAGSYYAAGFPTGGDELNNEIWDWEFVTMGYHYAENGYLEGREM